MSHHPHLTIEQIASSKVQQRKGILLNRILLYIYPVMPTLELAHPHIRRTVLTVELPRLTQTLRDEPLLLQLTHQIYQ